MKLVINGCFGGFSLPEGFCEKYGFESCYVDIARDDERLVQWMEEHPEDEGVCTDLQIVEIPDEATDYHIDEYDGFETVVYVVDGKLHWTE